MRKSLILISILVLMLGANVSARTAEEEALPTVDEAFEMLGQYQPGGSTKALKVIEQYVPTTTFIDALGNKTAERLMAVVQNEKNTPASRSFACRQLALVGGDTQIPMLEKLLKDTTLQSDALYALVAIPGKASSDALLNAFGAAKGDFLVAVINAVGERRLEDCLTVLVGFAGNTNDNATQNAAVAAIGNIGSSNAGTHLLSLHKAGNHSEAIHKAMVVCADLLRSEMIYRALFASTEASEWRVAGLKGLCEMHGSTIMQDLSTAILSDDPFLCASAIRMAGTVRDEQTAMFMSQWMPKLNVNDQARLIEVIGEYGVTDALSLIKPFMRSDNALLQSKAIAAIARIGDASMVQPLVDLAVSGNNDATNALLGFRGNEADNVIMSLAESDDSAVAVVAINILDGRHAQGSEPTFLKAIQSKDAEVRTASWKALASMEQIPVIELLRLAERIPAPDKGEVRRALQAAFDRGAEFAGVNTNCVMVIRELLRLNDRDETIHGKVVLIRSLAGLGTELAVKIVRPFLEEEDTILRDAAVRALSEWVDASAGDDLLKIVQSSESPVHRTLAMRGYLRLASAEKNAEMLAKAKELASTPDAKRQLLSGLSQAGGEAALKLATSFLADSDVKDEAVLAVLTIAEPIAFSSRAAVSEALVEVAKASSDKDVLARVESIRLASLSSVKGLSPAPYGREEIDNRRKTLIGKLPEGVSLAAYMDCGMESVVREANGYTIIQPAGSVYAWPGAAEVAPAPCATVAYDSRSVSFEIAGLKKDKHYALGFSWWDYDGNGRKESVSARRGDEKNKVEILSATPLPAFTQGQHLPAEYQIALAPALTVAGMVAITFQSQAGPNAVVSEIWLLESSEPIVSQLPEVSAPVVEKKEEPKKVLIVTGRDYPAHLWRETTPVLEAILAGDKRFEVFVVEDAHFLDSAAINRYDTILLHYMDQDVEAPGEQARKNLVEFVKSGKGLVLVHFSCGAFQDWPEFVDLVGRVWDPKLRGHDKRGPFRVDITDVKHPITQGMKGFDTDDELYTCLTGEVPVEILATAVSNVDGKTYPMAFVLDVGKGRVFHTLLGHDVKAFSFPGVGNLIRRGTAWASGLSQMPIGE